MPRIGVSAVGGQMSVKIKGGYAIEMRVLLAANASIIRENKLRRLAKLVQISGNYFKRLLITACRQIKRTPGHNGMPGEQRGQVVIMGIQPRIRAHKIERQ